MEKVKKDIKNNKILYGLILILFFIIITMVINDLKYKRETNLQISSVKKEALEGNQIQTLAVSNTQDNKYTTATDVENMILNLYPIGSIYISTNETNPGEYIGGTWENYGEGRTIVGKGTVADKVFNLGTIGGEYEHKLTIEEMPSHVHRKEIRGQVNDNFSNNSQNLYISGGSSVASTYGSTNTESTGGGKAHNNMQPYIVVNMWKRTS